MIGIFKKYLLFGMFMGMCSLAHASNVLTQVDVPKSVIVSSITASQGIAVVVASTSTFGANIGPYSTGQYVYVTNIHIEMYAVSTLTGGATPVTCTTVGLPTNASYKFPTAAATGSTTIMDMQFANPLQGSLATQFQLSCPSTANVIWNVQVAYFVAP